MSEAPIIPAYDQPGARSLPDVARACAQRHSMFPRDSCVVALVSGGADSVALLRLLVQHRLLDEPREDTAWLTVLHVNHMFRGAESDADEAFVESLCDELGVHAVSVRFDVAAYAESEGLNLEDAGRRIRYRFAEEELDARCRAAGIASHAGRIAVAHTLDDRIETFFMRVLTGAGLGGLSSIAPVRGRVVRPLLEAGRQEVRDWLRALDQPWREDASNEDVRRFRALVRHELMPLAESVNPRFRTSLARTLDLLADDDTLLDEMAQAFARDFATIDEASGVVAFDRSAMGTLSRPMLRRTIRAAIHAAHPDSSRLEYAHVEALADGIKVDGFAHDLPGGLRATCRYGEMLVTRMPEAPRHVRPGLLEMPGTLDVGEAGSIAAEETDPSDTMGTARSVVFDATGLEGPLVVDGIRPGDRMRPLGMDGSRKVSDLLVDAKVPRRERTLIPVVRAGERIIWLAGVRMSEEFRLHAGTQRAVRLTWRAYDEAETRR